MVVLFWYFGPKIKDEFKELYLEKFRHDGVEPKTMVGTLVFASDFSSYIEYFVNLLNSDQTLLAQSIVQV